MLKRWPSSSDEADLIAWNGTGQCPTVRIAPGLLQNLAEIVLAGYRSFPWGGTEVGGILLGTKQENAVYIHTFRPIECEHEDGPAFELSGSDLNRLTELLRTVAQDSTFAGLTPVGWYHSVSERDLSCTEQDQALHNRFFRQPGHIAMILKRSPKDPLLIGLFSNTGGSLQLHSSHREFPVDNFRLQPDAVSAAVYAAKPTAATVQKITDTRKDARKPLPFLARNESPSISIEPAQRESSPVPDRDSPPRAIQRKFLGNPRILTLLVLVVILLAGFWTISSLSGHRERPVNPVEAKKADSKPLETQTALRAVNLPADSTKAKSHPPAASPAKGSEAVNRPVPGQVYLQLYASPQNLAEIVVEDLHKKGFAAIASEIGTQPGTFRVLVGPLLLGSVTDTGIERMREDLEAAGFPGKLAFRRTF